MKVDFYFSLTRPTRLRARVIIYGRTLQIIPPNFTHGPTKSRAQGAAMVRRSREYDFAVYSPLRNSRVHFGGERHIKPTSSPWRPLPPPPPPPTSLSPEFFIAAHHRLHRPPQGVPESRGFAADGRSLLIVEKTRTTPRLREMLLVLSMNRG